MRENFDWDAVKFAAVAAGAQGAIQIGASVATGGFGAINNGWNPSSQIGRAEGGGWTSGKNQPKVGSARDFFSNTVVNAPTVIISSAITEWSRAAIYKDEYRWENFFQQAVTSLVVQSLY